MIFKMSQTSRKINRHKFESSTVYRQIKIIEPSISASLSSKLLAVTGGLTILGIVSAFIPC